MSKEELIFLMREYRNYSEEYKYDPANFSEAHYVLMINLERKIQYELFNFWKLGLVTIL